MRSSAWLALLGIAAVVAPVTLLVWMPIALGVPHIANDLRYLVMPLPHWQRTLALVACGALFVLRVVAVATGTVLLRTEAIVVTAWLVAMVCLAPTSPLRLTAVLAVAALVIALPVKFAVVAATAHNAVAVIAWAVVIRPGRRRVAIATVMLATTVTAAALLGPRLADTTALAQAARALHVSPALALAFLVMQAAHYLIWLVWIPRARPARAAVLGAVIFIATGAVIATGCIDAMWTRTTYLALATFHIYLELVVLTARAARRRSP